MSHLLLQNILQKEVQQETRRETRTSWSWLIPVLHFNDCRVKELLLLDALAPWDVPAAQIAFISVTLLFLCETVYFDTQQDRSKNTPTCPQKMPRLIKTSKCSILNVECKFKTAILLGHSRLLNQLIRKQHLNSLLYILKLRSLCYSHENSITPYVFAFLLPVSNKVSKASGASLTNTLCFGTTSRQKLDKNRLGGNLFTREFLFFSLMSGGL